MRKTIFILNTTPTVGTIFPVTAHHGR